jgi:hypothetical protein
MTPEERASFGPDGPDMWLCYPPLAGKHLQISESNGGQGMHEIASFCDLSLDIIDRKCISTYRHEEGDVDYPHRVPAHTRTNNKGYPRVCG